MDTSNEDKPEPGNGPDNPMNYQTTGSISSDWQFDASTITDTSVGLVHTDNQMPVCRGDFVGASCSNSDPMVDSFGTLQWDDPTTSQNMGFSEINVQNDATPPSNVGIGRGGLPSLRMMDMALNPPSSMLRGGIFLPNAPGILPQSLAPFPADSGFIDRAALYSCFNAGNATDMMNSFGIPRTANLYPRSVGVMQEPQKVLANGGSNTMSGGQPQNAVNMDECSIDAPSSGHHMVIDGSPLRNEMYSESIVRSYEEARGVGVSSNESDETELIGGQDMEGNGGDMSAKSPGSKKRKWNVLPKGPRQSSEAPKDDPETQNAGDQKPALTSNMTGGKQGKQSSQASDPPKEEYIHVRARRGQATNSHSLAERVRREKISERMKFLQDLVPGCSKVTGKAVMLDEIINYVQSLQRQVEFLSMKLATVNPRMDFNMESLLAKNVLRSHAVSSTLGYPQEMLMAYPPLNPSQSVPQAPFLGMESHSDLLRRTINSQLTPMPGGLKEPIQLPNVWNDELNNVVQMSYETTAPLDSQDLNGSTQPGHMKVEH